MGEVLSGRVEGVLATTPRGGPAVVGALGTLLFVVTFFNFVQEVEVLGVRGPQVVAVLFSGLMSALVVYAGFRLYGSEFGARQRWAVAGASLAGLVFVYLVLHLTLAVRLVGAQATNPALQLLASAHAGALAGFTIGWLFVTARQDAREAERVGEQLEFMHGIVRHDVRNSMMVVQARAEHLAERVDGHAESLDAIRSQAESVIDLSKRARATVDALADEAHSPSAVDCVSHLEEAVATTRETYDLATVTLDAPERAFVAADEMLPAVFGNLLGNAVEHNDAERPRVSVDVRVDAETVTVRVADNGPGIPDEEKAAVFERGYSSGGGGFGLFFVDTMVRYYGGEVTVEDRRGRHSTAGGGDEPAGAVFVVTLPRAEPGGGDWNWGGDRAGGGGDGSPGDRD